MTQDRFEMKKADGRYITVDELYDLAKDEIIEELEDMCTEDALCLGNHIRENNGYATLYENNDTNLNDVLDGTDPAELLKMGNDNWDDYSDYFTYDYDLSMTDDVWYDLDVDDIAEAILGGEHWHYLNSTIKAILDDYEEAKEWIENFNPIREAGAVLLAKYTNCEADVTDLLQFIDALVRNDEAWEDLE